MSTLSSNIVKGGALIEDTARFVEVWDDSVGGEVLLERVVHDNVLGLPTQSRASAVATYVLRPRFVAPGPEVPAALRAILADRTAFTDACYFEATRADALLGRFAEEAVFDWHESGRLVVDVELVETWLDDLAARGELAPWSSSLKRRVAQGLIATLRDFGRLDGVTNSHRKEIARPGISTGGFAYTAYRLHQQGESSRGILSSSVWRRWLLDEKRVDEMLNRLASLGVIFYSVAGSTLRIDWRVDSLVEVARAAA